MSVEKLATGVMYFWISFKFNYFIHEETEKNRQVFVKSKGAKFQFMSQKKKRPQKTSRYNSVFDLFKTQKF